jgi:lysophospholipid acyltransferase (LPLAT)-like uncharacterized protein
MNRASLTDRLLPRLIAFFLRILGRTWRVHLHDRAGITRAMTGPSAPLIWVFWHNRLLVAPILYERFFRQRKGAALISRSKDGDLLAECIRRFGGGVVRGSTSRGGSSALTVLKRLLGEGCDVYITPDGPRGPRYNMGPGAVWLARSSGVPILPVNAEYSSVWRLGRWDGFIVPKPFARIDVTLQPLHECPGEAGNTAGQNIEDLLGVMMRETILQ